MVRKFAGKGKPARRPDIMGHRTTTTHMPRMKNPSPSTGVIAVSDLNHSGAGVARVEGKTVFIRGALPGETVRYHIDARHARYDDASAIAIVEASADRCEPRCAHFGDCGGCALQHLDPQAQARYKHRQLEQALERIGKARAKQWLTPVCASDWGYRARARLSVDSGPRNARPVLGYKRAQSRHVVPIRECPILEPALQALLAPLTELLAHLVRPHSVRELLLSLGECTDGAVRTLCWIVDGAVADPDRERFARFGAEHDCSVFLKAADQANGEALWPPASLAPSYRGSDGTRIEFLPWHFTQSNRAINTQLTNTLIELLAPSASDCVLDLFCGVGNFSLPLAKRVAHLIGIDVDAQVLLQARRNAAANGLSNAAFIQGDLFQNPQSVRQAPQPDLIVLDPPRSGAAALMPEVARLRPRRLCYVSCDVATLARDAGQLVREYGASLEYAGIFDMFPQTRHIESLAVFDFGV
jgi:23S rRNA (uracil1939-C5)-methyltransferase